MQIPLAGSERIINLKFLITFFEGDGKYRTRDIGVLEGRKLRMNIPGTRLDLLFLVIHVKDFGKKK